MFQIDLICLPGSNINDAVREAVYIANSAKRNVTFSFNEERMCTTPVDNQELEITRLLANYAKRVAAR